MITQELLHTLFNYNPDTGLFVWKVGYKVKGTIAGSIRAPGYVKIAIKRKRYFAHRLAWLYTHGVWPRTIDHKNRIKDDNRLCNLRDVTLEENLKNVLRVMAPIKIKRKVYCDVYFRKDRGTWRVRRRIGKSRFSLGCFSTKEAALAATANSI